jgi:hypothetical protein
MLGYERWGCGGLSHDQLKAMLCCSSYLFVLNFNSIYGVVPWMSLVVIPLRTS